jgi:hypothetical protein
MAAASKWRSRSPTTNRHTTKLYDRSSDEISLDEIERIVIWLSGQFGYDSISMMSKVSSGGD